MQTYQIGLDGHRLGHSAILCSLIASALIAISLTGCRRSVYDVAPSKLAQPQTISEWHVLGPFMMPNSDLLKGDSYYAFEHAAHTTEWEGVVEHDYLGDFGYPESTIDIKALKGLSRNSAIHRMYHQDGAYLLLHAIFPKLQRAAVYAVAEIESSEEADVGIGAGSDDGMRLWLNGQLLAKTPAAIRREARRYDHLCIGHLRRGTNILVAKVDQKEGDWVLGVDLMSVETAREAVVKEREGNMIVRKVLSAGEPFSLTLPILGEEQHGSLEIRDISGRIVWSRKGAFPPEYRATLPSLEESYYTCEFQSGGKRTTDGFFLGDPRHVYDRMRNARREMQNQSRMALVLDALLERYEQLNLSERVRRDELNWNRKVTMVLADGLLALSNLGGLDWQRTKGWHFRRFLSAIDGEPQDYSLYVPDQHRNRMPLVIMMPYKMQTSRRFLESVLISEAPRTDRVGRVAEKMGLAVAIVYGRGNSGGAPIGESDVFEAVRDIERDFPLDRDRLYLYGNCAGAGRAMRLAAHFPDVFAAVAAYRAETWPAERSEQPAIQWWSELNSPEHLAPSLSNMPVLFIHGDSDPEYPLAAARKAWERMRKRGCHADFKVLPGGGHSGGNDPEILAFEFLARQSRKKSAGAVRIVAPRLKYADSGPLRFDDSYDPRSPMEGEARLDLGRLTIQTHNVSALTIRPGRFANSAPNGIPVYWNGQRAATLLDGNSEEIRIGQPFRPQLKSSGLEGPIAEVFAEPFEIVVGHGGRALAVHSARSVAQALRSTWQSVFFNSCRLREEDQVSDKDLQAYHIVFVGKPSRTGKFSAALSRSSMSRGKGELSIGGNSYGGKQLTFAILQPNPLNLRKYLLLVDSTEDQWTLPETDLAHNGYYDFVVWNDQGEMIDSGLLDREWKKAVAFSEP